MLYLDLSMGAAGDMLAAALLGLLPDPAGFVEKRNGLGLPGVQFTLEKSVKCGIAGLHLAVAVHGQAEGHPHDHHRDHPHDHPGGSLAAIGHLVKDRLTLPEAVARDVLAVYGALAQAESQVHGVPVEEIHFHEVGTMDAVADVTAVCLLMHTLAPGRCTLPRYTWAAAGCAAPMAFCRCRRRPRSCSLRASPPTAGKSRASCVPPPVRPC